MKFLALTLYTHRTFLTKMFFSYLVQRCQCRIHYLLNPTPRLLLHCQKMKDTFYDQTTGHSLFKRIIFLMISTLEFRSEPFKFPFICRISAEQQKTNQRKFSKSSNSLLKSKYCKNKLKTWHLWREITCLHEEFVKKFWII